ncbi:hypothetical protein IHE45_08G069200 [Dioscorea alata]|uniref:Uncharacterized protein n=2 Tax=Dioscorea alata TaxID=55571 RepID=A0ACB7VJF7_DIOAL|nr:hypothetical protein IHE45_08G069200 [Dioscorea alata]KAH7674385.1 hypothetical protein IHE45_08G069200 [Dioscorea alata]
MEGVGARLGRSSTRYGPATVFSGPVRKWKKKWIPLASPASANTANNSSNGNGNNNNNHSHLLVYKWAPISSQSNGSASAATTPAADDTPKRKVRYVPVSITEEQKQEPTLKMDDESKTNDGNPSLHSSQPDGSDSKPDMNDVAMEDVQASEKDQSSTEEMKETNLDLSLGLKAHDDDRGSGTKIAEPSDGSGRAERMSSGEDGQMRPATNSESDNRLKRKAAVPDLEMRV